MSPTKEKKTEWFFFECSKTSLSLIPFETITRLVLVIFFRVAFYLICGIHKHSQWHKNTLAYRRNANRNTYVNRNNHLIQMLIEICIDFTLEEPNLQKHQTCLSVSVYTRMIKILVAKNTWEKSPKLWLSLESKLWKILLYWIESLYCSGLFRIGMWLHALLFPGAVQWYAEQ